MTQSSYFQLQVEPFYVYKYYVYYRRHLKTNLEQRKNNSRTKSQNFKKRILDFSDDDDSADKSELKDS